MIRRLRVPLSLAFGTAFFLTVRPSSEALFWTGFALALLGEGIRLWAAFHLHKNKDLVRTGPYALVRNPLYLGSATIAGGVCLAVSDPWRPLFSLSLWTSMALGFTFFYAYTIREEEEHLRRLFGQDFDRYVRKVPCLWPKPGRLPEALRTTRPNWALLAKNRELTTLAALLALSVLLRLKMTGFRSF